MRWQGVPAPSKMLVHPKGLGAGLVGPRVRRLNRTRGGLPPIEKTLTASQPLSSPIMSIQSRASGCEKHPEEEKWASAEELCDRMFLPQSSPAQSRHTASLSTNAPKNSISIPLSPQDERHKSPAAFPFHSPSDFRVPC